MTFSLIVSAFFQEGFFCVIVIEEYFLNTLLSGAGALGKDAFLKSHPLPVPSFAEGQHDLFIHMLSLTSLHVGTARAECKAVTAKSVHTTMSPKGRKSCHKMTDVATEIVMLRCLC